VTRPILLGVNVDHVATIRQARNSSYPDPVHAALQAELAGADGITMHLREDRRHIQDSDIERYAACAQKRARARRFDCTKTCRKLPREARKAVNKKRK